jgi:hypothetical protein
MAGKTKIDGIKIHAIGMMRLMDKAPKEVQQVFPLRALGKNCTHKLNFTGEGEE